MKLGIIARSDNTGLGNQTRELVNMLNPDRIMLINSQPFNRNKQHPEWYKGYDIIYTRGFPRLDEIRSFIKGLDVVLSCETFYSKDFIDIARKNKVKTVLQYNYEFLDHLQHPNLSLPDVLLAPSLWNFNTVSRLFGDKCSVVHLPPPTDIKLFEAAKNNNISKDHKRILHIAGKVAAEDRNGTKTVIEMLKYSKEDYELVIKAQGDINATSSDPRLKINTDNPDDRQKLYQGFDAMVLPRRYAGLCLPMNEALLSGLPVFMTDISPNNTILPDKWLVDSSVIKQLKTRTMLDVYEANPKKLAKLIDDYIISDKQSDKNEAVNIGITNFSVESLKEKYLDILNK